MSKLYVYAHSRHDVCVLMLVPEEDLTSLFGSCGKVDDVYMGYDRHHKCPFVVVTMADKAGADKAIAEFDYDLTKRHHMCGNMSIAINVRMLGQTRNEGTGTMQDGASEGASASRHDCRICMNPIQEFCAFLPCGHAGQCGKCARQIHQRNGKCPFCRKNIAAIQPVFLN